MFNHHREQVELEHVMQRLKSIAEGAEPDRPFEQYEAALMSSAVSLCVQLTYDWQQDYKARQAVAFSGVKFTSNKPSLQDIITLKPDRSTATLLALGHYLSELVEYIPEHAKIETQPIIDHATACLHAVGNESIYTVRSVRPKPKAKDEAEAIVDAVAACALASRITGQSIDLVLVDGDALTVESAGGQTVTFPIGEVINNTTTAVAAQLCQEFDTELHDPAKLAAAMDEVMPVVTKAKPTNKEKA